MTETEPDAAPDSDAGGPPPKKRLRRILLFVVLPLVAVFGLIQLIPNRVTNPPVLQEPNWDSPRTASSP